MLKEIVFAISTLPVSNFDLIIFFLFSDNNTKNKKNREPLPRSNKSAELRRKATENKLSK